MVVYEVIVRDEGLEFECECGQFEHTGMLCCHVLRVMDVLHLEEDPAKHIVKDGPKTQGSYCPRTSFITRKNSR